MSLDNLVTPTIANWLVIGLMAMTFFAFAKGILAVQAWMPQAARDFVLFA